MSVLADALSFVSVAAIPILFALGWLSLPVLLALVAFGARSLSARCLMRRATPRATR